MRESVLKQCITKNGTKDPSGRRRAHTAVFVIPRNIILIVSMYQSVFTDKDDAVYHLHRIASLVAWSIHNCCKNLRYNNKMLTSGHCPAYPISDMVCILRREREVQNKEFHHLCIIYSTFSLQSTGVPLFNTIARLHVLLHMLRVQVYNLINSSKWCGWTSRIR